MNIIETNLAFGSLSYRGSTTRIILHHAEASRCTADDIHCWHKANGWAGAGYHFLVRKDGKVYRLRPEWAIGSHAQGANFDSIGICAEGAFMTEKMGDVQRKAVIELVAYLKKKYAIKRVLRHRDVGSTSCPGTNYPFEAIVAGKLPAASDPKPKPDEKKVFKLAECIFYLEDEHRFPNGKTFPAMSRIYWTQERGCLYCGSEPGGASKTDGTINLLKKIGVPVINSNTKNANWIGEAYRITEPSARETFGDVTLAWKR